MSTSSFSLVLNTYVYPSNSAKHKYCNVWEKLIWLHAVKRGFLLLLLLLLLLTFIWREFEKCSKSAKMQQKLPLNELLKNWFFSSFLYLPNFRHRVIFSLRRVLMKKQEFTLRLCSILILLQQSCQRNSLPCCPALDAYTLTYLCLPVRWWAEKQLL